MLRSEALELQAQEAVIIKIRRLKWQRGNKEIIIGVEGVIWFEMQRELNFKSATTKIRTKGSPGLESSQLAKKWSGLLSIIFDSHLESMIYNSPFELIM
jgi:hypothetical protein